MNLPIVEGKPKVRLILGFARQAIPSRISCVVVIFLMVAHPRHKRCIRCEALGQLAKQVPNGFELSDFLRIHPSVSDISRQEDEVQRLYEMIFSYLLHYKMAERGKSTHVSKDGHAYLLKLLYSQRWRFKVFYLWKGPSFGVSDPIVVRLQRFKVLHDRFVDSTVKAKVSNIVSGEGSLLLKLKGRRQSSILHDGLVVKLRRGYPHDLHLCFFCSESNVDLFISGVRSDLNLCNLD